MTDPVPFARGGAYPPRPGNAARPPATPRGGGPAAAGGGGGSPCGAATTGPPAPPPAPAPPRVGGGGSDEDISPTIPALSLELSGPAATDVHHNFVQRWNEASE